MENVKLPIPYIPPNQTRILVGVATNLSNDNTDIVKEFYKKLAQYWISITTIPISSSDLMIGYRVF